MTSPLYVEIDEELRRRAKGQPEFRMGLDDERKVGEWEAELEEATADDLDGTEPSRPVLIKVLAILHAWVETIDRR